MDALPPFTDEQLQELINMPKIVRSRKPASGYKTEKGHERCTMELSSDASDITQFAVFIRRSTRFIENFTIGLLYCTNMRGIGDITLLRYNGAHGETSRAPDGHYAKPHIHWLTSEDIEEGITEPQEKKREITDEYSTLDEALEVFSRDINIVDFGNYPIPSTQRRLFDES